jgi:ribosomal protein S18 acetylase RimI-like enzyme
MGLEMAHPLDNPAWAALTGPHAGLGTVHGLVRRYDSEIAPFAAMEELTPAGFADLVGSMTEAGVVLVTPGVLEPPETLDVVLTMVGMQMIAPRLNAADCGWPAEELGADDVPAILELVALTKPGPFARRTREMGRYVGFFDSERLVAMAGERMRLPGYTEVSAVCTHPDYRGRGFAGQLVSAIADGVLQRGEVPMLHVVGGNHAAIKLYEALGFAKRSDVQFTFLKRHG